MVQKYKNVAIVYGGSGRKYAEAIKKAIIQRHSDEMIPFQAKILDKVILDSKSIMDYVVQMLSEASVYVIILTFDDVNNTRVRQNILLETGIAWTLGGKSNCIFLSDRDNIPNDFPSNIKTDINVNYFKAENINAVAQSVCDEIISKLNFDSASNLLYDNYYTFDGKILDDIPEEILEKKSNVQLQCILEEWKSSMNSFDYFEEKVIYFLERMPFLPVFNNDENLHTFLYEVSSIIAPSGDDIKRYHHSSEDINQLYRFVEQIIKYSDLKLEKAFLAQMKNPKKYCTQLKEYIKKYKFVANKIQSYIEYMNQRKEMNWLIQITAYDYLALAKLKVFEINQAIGNRQAEYITLIDSIINTFEKAASIAEKKDTCSNCIWLGFIKYNLARAYIHKYKLTADAESLELFEEALLESIDIRHSWYSRNMYHGVFATAMSYEYFIAAQLDYSLRNDIVDYTNDSPIEIISQIKALKSELDKFCRESELGRLYDVRDIIGELEKRIKAEHHIH